MIRVLIVDDDPLVRVGLHTILASSPDILVVGEASDGADALLKVEHLRPDVVYLDVRMPGTDGLAALDTLHSSPNPPQAIVLTTFDLDEYVYRALRAGAAGFLFKDTPPHELIGAARIVSEGSAVLAPSVTRRLIDAFAAPTVPDRRAAGQRLAVLTNRENDIVRAVGRGLSNAEIARELHMTETTVKAHVSRSLTKLGLANRVQVALLVRDAYGGL